MRSIVLSFFILIAFLGMGRAYAGETITLGPQGTKIEGSIKYTVIGTYTARFNSFTGRITLGKRSQGVRSVYLEIEAGSIRSNHPWYDKIARSRRLLYARRYPKIIFKSDKIVHDEGGYKIKGILEMHGIKRRMTFPFNIEITIDQKTKRKQLVLKGHWNINRKVFNIIWNRYLDHGGVLVSDIFTVNWEIRAHIK